MKAGEFYSILSAFFNRVSGIKGCLHIAAADGATKTQFGTFVVQEDAAFTTITGTNGSNESIDVKVLLGINGKTMKAGAVITVPLGTRITLMTLSAGAVIGYNE